MGWKLLILAGVGIVSLWALGFGPDDVQRLASDAGYSTASAVTPSSDSGGWGRPG